MTLELTNEQAASVRIAIREVLDRIASDLGHEARETMLREAAENSHAAILSTVHEALRDRLHGKANPIISEAA